MIKITALSSFEKNDGRLNNKVGGLNKLSVLKGPIRIKC